MSHYCCGNLFKYQRRPQNKKYQEFPKDQGNQSVWRGHILLMKKRTGFGSQILNKLRKNSFYTVNSHLFLFKKCLIVCYEETIAELNKDVSFSYNDIFWITKMNIRADKATEFILTDPDRALKMVFDAFTQEELGSNHLTGNKPCRHFRA